MNKCLILFYLLFISLNYSNNNFENSLVFNFIKSDTTKYLFLDDRIIKQTFNVKLEVGKVEKHPNNPLFTEDKEWEMRFDNLYGNVIFDKDEKIYKLWYSPFIVDSKNLIKELISAKPRGNEPVATFGIASNDPLPGEISTFKPASLK